MASQKVAEFFAVLGVKVDKRGFITAQKNLGDITSKVKGFLAAAGALAAGRAISGIVNDVTKTNDSLAKLSTGLGISTDALQTFQFAGERSGVTSELLNTALAKLPRKLADAAAGSVVAQQTFDALGLSAAELVKLSPEEQFLEIADGFKRMQDPAARTTVALRLFEETGARFIPLLRSGRDGIRAYGEELTNLGGRIDRDAIEKSVQWRDALTNLDRSLLGLKVALVRLLLPTLQRASQAFQRARATTQRWAKDGTLGQLTQQVKQLGIVLGIVLLPVLAPVIASFATWAAAVLLPIAAIGAFILIIESLLVWVTGGKSIIGEFFDTLHSEDANDWPGVGILRFIFGGIGEAAADAMYWVQELITQVKDFFKLDFSTQYKKLARLPLSIAEGLGTISSSVGEVAADFLGLSSPNLAAASDSPVISPEALVSVISSPNISPTPAAAVANRNTNNISINTPVQIKTTGDPEQTARLVRNVINQQAAEVKSQLTESR